MCKIQHNLENEAFRNLKKKFKKLLLFYAIEIKLLHFKAFVPLFFGLQNIIPTPPSPIEPKCHFHILRIVW